METKKTQNINNSKWNDLYKKVVTEISQKESPRDIEIKRDLFERFKETVKGKDFIIHNSCK
jgi:hypothetical protein